MKKRARNGLGIGHVESPYLRVMEQKRLEFVQTAKTMTGSRNPKVGLNEVIRWMCEQCFMDDEAFAEYINAKKKMESAI